MSRWLLAVFFYNCTAILSQFIDKKKQRGDVAIAPSALIYLTSPVIFNWLWLRN
jgi:hypothetical protein